jgi:hypothetical protein
VRAPRRAAPPAHSSFTRTGWPAHSPVLDFYKKKGVVHSIDAFASFDQVFGQVNAVMKK